MNATIPHPMTTTTDHVDDLVTEFREVVGLPELDAYRSAFCALAHNAGWNSARVGRYLGISRARVGQRLDRFRQYAANRGDMPILKHLMDTAPARSGGRADGATDPPVGFEAEDSWRDPAFAAGVLQQFR